MQKKNLSIIAAVVLAACFTMSAYATVETTENQNPQDAYSDDDFETNQYYYEDKNGTKMGFVTVTNHSGDEVSVKVNATAYGASGEELGTQDSAIDVLGPDETSIAVISFYGIDGSIDHFDYEVEYERSKNYQSVLSNMKAEESVDGGNVTLTVTNEGTTAAQYFAGYVFFLDADNNLIDYDSSYITDDDGELKPGATLSAQFHCSEEFDHVECYFEGRSDGTTGTVQPQR